MHLVIGSGCSSDLSDIADFLFALQAGAPAGVFRTNGEIFEDFKTRLTICNNGAGVLVVGRCNANFAGYGLGLADATDIHCEYGVAHRFQGKGYGKRLLEQIVAWPGARQKRRFVGVCHERNRSSQSVLKSQGFELSESEPDQALSPLLTYHLNITC